MLSQTDAGDIDATYYLYLASFAVLFYDYALTFEMEISRFWSPKQHNWGRTLFLLNRYGSLFGHITIIAKIFLRNPTANLCDAMEEYHEWLAIAMQFIIGGIMITRTYALWDSNRKILVFLLVLGVVVISFGGWIVLHVKSETTVSALYPGVIGCHLGSLSNQSYYMGAAWGGMVLFDTVIFALTVYKSLTFGRTGHRSIVDVFLLDGALYFAIIDNLALFNALTFMFGRPYSRGMLTVTTNILSSVCATRLMLNIRRRDQSMWLDGSWSNPDASCPNIPGFGIIGLDPSFLPERPVGNELEEPRQDGLEPLSLGQSEGIQSTV